jgi:hypothetical protein
MFGAKKWETEPERVVWVQIVAVCTPADPSIVGPDAYLVNDISGTGRAGAGIGSE